MKKGYTLIELIIVIAIIGVLLLAFRNVFQVKNKDALYGEACINNLYGEVSNYLYSAITSKAISSGDTRIRPDTYYIEFDTSSDTNAIRFTYSGAESGAGTGRNLAFTGTSDMPSNYNCTSNAYKIVLDGMGFKVQINKGLTEDANLQSMSILSGENRLNVFTSEVKFLLNYPGSTGYRELGKFVVDIRTQSIKSKMCLDVNNTGNCRNRDTSGPINGACGSTQNICIIGTPANLQHTAGDDCDSLPSNSYSWDCLGSYGGTDALNCSSTEPC